jgi:7-cyano-7-deazaguanine synthase in queuosine biosynthesis
VTSLYLRVRPDDPLPPDGLLLDWFGDRASSVSGKASDLTRGIGEADASTIDLLRLAVAVYSADKAALRSREADRWTRALDLDVPVADAAAWTHAADAFSSALAFLSNDRWSLQFRAEPPTQGGEPTALLQADACCLFSGGLDSLAGAIDLLEEGRTVILVGHYDSNLLRPRQKHLASELAGHYGAERVIHRPFYLRLASPAATQARPLAAEREATTRSRSLLFIAAAGVAASAAGLDEIYMPENGYIGLNIPLEMSRLGACSTRTTHPHFMSLLAEAFQAAEIRLRVMNPFRLKTKAEVIGDCRNPGLLLALAPSSISCAHPEVGRWSGEGYGNCGYCYPCLMRRVAMHAAGADDPAAYRVDAGDIGFRRAASERTEHIRALIANEQDPPRPTDVLRSGPLPRGEVTAFRQLYERGRAEITDWLTHVVPGSA